MEPTPFFRYANTFEFIKYFCRRYGGGMEIYMKNIFGLNKTLYSEEGQEAFDGASFITKSLSNDVDKEEEKSEKNAKKQ